MFFPIAKWVLLLRIAIQVPYMEFFLTLQPSWQLSWFPFKVLVSRLTFFPVKVGRIS